MKTPGNFYLSIITINYNNINGLKNTCESVAKQTFQDFEWLIIDGGSTDGGSEYIESFQRQPDYYISEPDKGVYNAMNKGIAIAHGDYLLFLNSGDYLVDEHVLQSVKDSWHKVEDSDIIYGDAFFCRGAEEHEEHYPEFFSLYDYWRIYTMCHQATFIRASLLKEKGYDESYRIVADFKRWIEWKLEERSFCHLPITICRYQMDGISSTNLELHHKEHDQVMNELLSPIMLEQMKYIDDLKGNYEKRYKQEIERRDQEIGHRDQEIASLQEEIKNREDIINELHKELTFFQHENLKHIRTVRILLCICITGLILLAIILFVLFKPFLL